MIADGGITLVFDAVVFGGTTLAEGASAGADAPEGFEWYTTPDDVRFWELSTTATTAGGILACFGFDPATVEGDGARLWYDGGAGFVDVTGEIDAVEGSVCGEVSALGTFAIAVDVDECEVGACSAGRGLSTLGRPALRRSEAPEVDPHVADALFAVDLDHQGVEVRVTKGGP